MADEHSEHTGQQGSAGEPGRTGESGRGDRMAEEFRLLLDAAAWRAEEYLRGAGGSTTGGSDRQDSAPGGSASCGWCPICAIAALVRGDRPELTERLADQLAGLVELLRDSLAEHEHGHERTAPDPRTGAHDRAEPAAAPKVQRIDVRRTRGGGTPRGQGNAEATGD